MMNIEREAMFCRSVFYRVRQLFPLHSHPLFVRPLFQKLGVDEKEVKALKSHTQKILQFSRI